MAGRPEAGRGFTLIELLVVLFIVGIITSFATLSIGQDRSSALEEEAQRLRAVVKLAADEAVLSGREIALQFTPEGYEFLTLEDKKWAPLNDDPAFGKHMLPSDMQVELRIEGERVTPRGAKDKAEPALVLLLSSGELTPFEATVVLADSERRYTLTGGLTGELTLRAG